MNAESKRAVIAAVRKVMMAGLILLVFWLTLLALRGAVPVSVFKEIIPEGGRTGVINLFDPGTWDWTKSLWHDQMVSAMIGQYLGNTLRLMALIGLMSLIIAGILLFIGFFLSRMTESPGWLLKLRGILRSILVSGGASIPLFVFGTIFLVIFINNWHWVMQADSAGALLWSAFIISFLPAWLLVQTGHGIMAKGNDNIDGFQLAKEVGIRLFIRLLKLVGLIIVVTLLAEQDIAQPGLGRIVLSAVNQRDFPVIFGAAWVLVIIVVLVKLVAELIEIAYDYSNKIASSAEQVTKESPLRLAIPKGWFIFSVGLCAFFIMLAVFAPLLAPYGMNEVNLMDRLSPPSAKYLLGTDQLGRDILSRLLYGIRIDVLIGLACAAVLSVIAAGWGILASYLKRMNNWLGDTLEDVVMLPREIICSFPWLVLLLFLMSMTAGTSIMVVAVIAGLVMLPHTVGMIQEAYHSVLNRNSRLQGVLKAIPVVFLFTTAGVMIYVSTISYMGFGIPPGVPELGSLLSSEGRQYLFTAPGLGLWPGLSLTCIILVFVTTGDALLERLGFRSKAVWSKTME